MERDTVAVYEQRAADWAARRPPKFRAQAAAFAARCLPGLPRLDVGSGPGSYLADLGRPAVALDAAFAMVDIARRIAPDVPVVQADLEAPPLRRGSLGGAWARASYLHVPRTHLPMALARLHDSLAVGAPLHMSMHLGEGEGPMPDDEFSGRFFARWRAGELGDVVAGAGFSVDSLTEQGDWILVDATRQRTLPDYVGPGLRMLVCGLNPSVVAADAGFGYAGPTNRYWKAAAAAGLTTVPRRPWTGVARDAVGMTDMVKRATPRSSDLTRDEYRQGAARVERIVEWLSPRLVLFVGLEGWRAAVDTKAVAGLQEGRFGGAPAYVMPSTSGLNAHARLDDLVAHMRTAQAAATA